MTILESNQPWPQIQVKSFNPSIGVFGGYEFDTADQSIEDLVCAYKDRYTYRHNYKPSTLFAGPRAINKIKNLIAQDKYLSNTITTKPLKGIMDKEKKILGMQLILTIDDGLWIA